MAYVQSDGRARQQMRIAKGVDLMDHLGDRAECSEKGAGLSPRRDAIIDTSVENHGRRA